MQKDGVTLSPELWEELAPFSLIFNSKGRVISVAQRIQETWILDKSKEDLFDQVNSELTLLRPFQGPFDPNWIPDLTDVIVHLALSSNLNRLIRGEFYKHEDGWLFTGFPMVASIGELEEMGINLSRLPLHSSLGERLIANETSQASLREAQLKAKELERTLENFERFIPKKLLENIGVETHLDTMLGKHVETRKAVMFADLRGFTTISEQLEAGQIFEIINQYLSCTVPCIEANDGYVIQYLGDGIMALFPSGNVAALKAAIEMQKALRHCQQEHSQLKTTLRMSIGIHEGPVALGIVGNETRWDASIIADAVNTSSRIEAMTRVLGGEIIVSKSFLENAGDTSHFKKRDLGVQQIRGRKGLIPLVEILDSLEPQDIEKRDRTSQDFSNGIKAYQNGDLYVAMSCFSQVLAMVPTDQAAQFYLGRISQRLNALPV